MQITVYSGFSKRLNSTKQPTGGTTIDCVLKSPTSVVKPTFRITDFNLAWNYVLWGSRYYFVDDIVILTNDIAEISCSLDVLATYKTQIGNDREYVTRAASQYDLNITDAEYPTKAVINHSVAALSGINTDISVASGSYVIGIKSKESSTGVAFYGLSESGLKSLVDYLYSDVWLDATDITKSLQKLLIDPFDYIVSANWYPFDTTTGGRSEHIYFGYWDSGVSGNRITDAMRTKIMTDVRALPSHPQLSRGNYLNGAPFTQMYLDAFVFGRVPLDANMFLESRSCITEIMVDLFTGVGVLQVSTATGVVYKASATCSVPIQLSQVNTDILTPLMSAVSAGVQFEAGKVLGGISNIANTVTSAMPQISTVGSVGSIAAYAYNQAEIELRFYNIIDEDLTTIGRPLCQVKQISSLSGYIKCENVDIDTVGTSSEKRQIIDFMEGGFYYE